MYCTAPLRSPSGKGGNVMPITYHFMPDQKLVITVHVGTIPDDEFMNSYISLYKDARFDREFNQLVDLRQTDSSARDPETLQSFATFVQEQFRNSTATPKVAVIAPSDLSFGLARMYEAFSNIIPWDFVVFRSVDAALAWLGLPDNLTDDIEQNAQPEYSLDSE